MAVKTERKKPSANYNYCIIYKLDTQCDVGAFWTDYNKTYKHVVSTFQHIVSNLRFKFLQTTKYSE